MSRPVPPGAPGDAVERFVLPNGLTVLLRRDASAPVVAIVTYVKAGYFDESDAVVGVSHVLEHMYFKGTPTRGPGEIARATKAAGGYLNAGTIYDHTSYYTVLPASGFAEGIAVQADAFAASSIDAGELAREIEVIIEEESRKRDSPSAVANETCYALLFDVHRMRRWRMGTPAQLRALTRDDVARFYRTHYVPSNTILSVVGDIDLDRARADITARYGALAPGTSPRDRGAPEPARTGFRWRDLERDVGQAQLVLGWRTLAPLADGVLSADATALDAAASVLGSGRASRLFREVRERGLASSVSAFHFTPTELGVFGIAAETPVGGLVAAARAAWGEVRALGEHPPSSAELTRVQHGVDAQWWRRLESMEGQAQYLASWEALGGWERGAQYLEQFLALTPARIRDATREYLTLDRAALVTVRATGSDLIASDADAVRALLAEAPPTAAVRRDAAQVESPGPMGLATHAAHVVGSVHVFARDGDVPVLIRRKPGASMTYVQALFTGGATDETDATGGLTTLLTRTALQGTVRRDGPQLAEDIEALGGTLSGFAGSEVFGWTLSIPTARLRPALSLLAEVVEQPRLADDALETERAVALSGLARLRDDMSRQPIRLALAAAFADHPYGRSTLGTEHGLMSCSAPALRAWHERVVQRGHGAIVAVGDATHDELAAAVRGAFRRLVPGARRAVPAVEWPTQALEAVERRDKAQTALALLYPAPRRDAADRRASDLLATIASGMGGRLFQALRDRESLAYTVQLGARALSRAGWFTAYLACAPSKEGAARDGLVRECLRLATDGVTEEELARAKAYTVGSLAIRQQSAAAILGDIADAWLFGSLDELEWDPLESTCRHASLSIL